jgi:hypothetical protein
MRTLARYAFSIGTAAALLTGCGGSQPPISDPGAMPQSRLIAMHADRGKSWMLPEAKRDNLLYVADKGSNDVYVYSYPSGKLVGTLTGLSPGGDCVDKAGDVWIVSWPDSLYEFAHGGTSPIATLSVTGNAELISCSVDQLTGNLAVTSWYANVLIFPQAKGTPTTYRARWYSHQYCVYDPSGNLYISGTVDHQDSWPTALFELKNGGTRIHRLWFRPRFAENEISFPGGMQWANNEVVYGSFAGPAAAYQLTQGKDTVRIAGSTILNGTNEVKQFWIQGKSVIAPYFSYSGGGGVEILTYPKGKLLLNITGLDIPFAATVSMAKK